MKPLGEVGGMQQMNDVKRRKELTQRVEQRRRELAARPDTSNRMRKLSESSSRNQIGKQRKRSTTLSFIIGGFAVIALVACVASAVAVTAGGLWLKGQLDDPSQVTLKFYTSLHQQDYHLAYSYLSGSFKAHVSESAFTDKYGSYDQISGIVEHYTVTKSDVGDTTATVAMIVARRGDPTTAQVQTLRLIKEGSDWHIDSITLGDTVQVTPTT